jgi:hypothetical protein
MRRSGDIDPGYTQVLHKTATLSFVVMGTGSSPIPCFIIKAEIRTTTITIQLVNASTITVTISEPPALS